MKTVKYSHLKLSGGSRFKKVPFIEVIQKQIPKDSPFDVQS